MMKKNYLFFTFLFFIFFLFGCEAIDAIKMTFNTDASTLKNRITEMITNDNFQIDSETNSTLSTGWRKVLPEENNIPDYTIEAKLEATFSPTGSGTEIIMKIMKRSSLDSKDPNMPSYIDIGIIKNDLLYKRWSEKLKTLKEEYK